MELTRFTSLKKYDYNKLYHWLTFLSSLDFKSNIFPYLASNYYIGAEVKEDVAFMVKYLGEHAQKDINKKEKYLIVRY